MERSVSSQSAHTIHLDFRHKFLFSQKLRDLAVEDVPHFYILQNPQEIMNWHKHCVGKTALKMREYSCRLFALLKIRLIVKNSFPSQ